MLCSKKAVLSYMKAGRTIRHYYQNDVYKTCEGNPICTSVATRLWDKGMVCVCGRPAKEYSAPLSLRMTKIGRQWLADHP